MLRRTWNRQFASTYNLSALSETLRPHLEKLVAERPSGRMLDNGCGTGRVKKFFEEAGWECFGTDVSAEALKIAAVHTPEHLFCTPSTVLPFEKNFFDLIVFHRVLHNLPRRDRTQALQEVRRVLVEGGRLFCSVQAFEDTTTRKEYQEEGEMVSDDPGSFTRSMEAGKSAVPYFKHFFRKEEIEDLLIAAGFSVQSIEPLFEESGFSSRGGQKQMYWLLKAVKQG